MILNICLQPDWTKAPFNTGSLSYSSEWSRLKANKRPVGGVTATGHRENDLFDIKMINWSIVGREIGFQPGSMGLFTRLLSVPQYSILTNCKSLRFLLYVHSDAWWIKVTFSSKNFLFGWHPFTEAQWVLRFAYMYIVKEEFNKEHVRVFLPAGIMYVNFSEGISRISLWIWRYCMM